MINEYEKRTILSLAIWNACKKTSASDITDGIVNNIYKAGMLDIAVKNMRNNNITYKSSLLESLLLENKSRYDFIMENTNDFLSKIKNFTYVNLKGLVLNYYVYGKIDSYRLMHDCDILVPQISAKELVEYIKSELPEAIVTDNEELNKYYFYYLQHLPEIKYKNFSYEVHHRLDQLGEPYPIDSNYMFDHTFKYKNYIFPSFDLFFISVCQHVFRHEYLEATYKWRSICDIINIILLHPINWENIKNLIDMIASRFIIYYVLKRAQTVYEFVCNTSLLDSEIIEMFSSEHDCDIENIIFKTYYPGSSGFYPIGVWNQAYLDRLFKGRINDLNRFDPVSIDFNYQFVRKVQYDNNVNQCNKIGVDFNHFVDNVVPPEAISK